MISRIKHILEQKNLSPSRFADQIDVPRSTISHILSGRNKPSLEVILKILNAFPDIPVEWMLQGKGNYHQQSYTLFDTDDESTNQDHAIEQSEPIEKEDDKLDDPSSVIDEKKDHAKPEQPDPASLITNDKPSGIAEKVIILYADGTFKEYKPSV